MRGGNIDVAELSVREAEAHLGDGAGAAVLPRCHSQQVRQCRIALYTRRHLHIACSKAAHGARTAVQHTLNSLHAYLNQLSFASLVM